MKIQLLNFKSEYRSGLYVESFIDKELFLEALLECSKVVKYLNGWQEEVRPIIPVDCIEHCWMTEDDNPTVNFDYEVVSLPQIGKPVTFYEFWIYE